MSDSGQSFTYVQGEKQESHDHAHDALPLPLYYKIFGALIFLTVITVAVSYMGLGEASLAVAMIVATVKAALVVGYFMHLKYDDRLLSLVGVLVMLFVFTFFGLTFADLTTREEINVDWGNHAYFEYRIDQSPSGDDATCAGNINNCWEKRREDFKNLEGGHH